MEEFILSVSDRQGNGSSGANRMRRAGRIPAVVYAAGEKSASVSVGLKEFTQLARKATSAQLFTLKSDNSALNNKLAIVKEIQREYLKGGLLHIDLLTLREDREITVNIPLHFVGEAPGVKNEGGVLSVSSHDVSITCLPRKIPHHIEVSVTALNLGDSIHARELTLTEGVRLAGKPDETIVSVVLVRTLVETVAPVAAAAEGVAGATPAEGAEKTAEGAAKAEGAGAGDAKDGAKEAKGKEKSK